MLPLSLHRTSNRAFSTPIGGTCCASTLPGDGRNDVARLRQILSHRRRLRCAEECHHEREDRFDAKLFVRGNLQVLLPAIRLATNSRFRQNNLQYRSAPDEKKSPLTLRLSETSSL